jgi:hypothetical protein
MLMISPIFLTGRRVSFASAVPEQKKFMTPSGSAARRECPGSSRRLNRAVATIRSMHRPSQQYSSTKRGPGAGFCNALQHSLAHAFLRENGSLAMLAAMRQARSRALVWGKRCQGQCRPVSTHLLWLVTLTSHAVARLVERCRSD